MCVQNESHKAQINAWISRKLLITISLQIYLFHSFSFSLLRLSLIWSQLTLNHKRSIHLMWYIAVANHKYAPNNGIYYIAFVGSIFGRRTYISYLAKRILWFISAECTIESCRFDLRVYTNGITLQCLQPLATSKLSCLPRPPVHALCIAISFWDFHIFVSGILWFIRWLQ